MVLIYTLPSTMFTINALHKHYIHRLLYVKISAGTTYGATQDESPNSFVNSHNDVTKVEHIPYAVLELYQR